MPACSASCAVPPEWLRSHVVRHDLGLSVVRGGFEAVGSWRHALPPPNPRPHVTGPRAPLLPGIPCISESTPVGVMAKYRTRRTSPHAGRQCGFGASFSIERLGREDRVRRPNEGGVYGAVTRRCAPPEQIPGILDAWLADPDRRPGRQPGAPEPTVSGPVAEHAPRRRSERRFRYRLRCRDAEANRSGWRRPPARSDGRK